MGFLLFPGFEVLDVFGPLELFACKPMRTHFKPAFVAEQRGPVESAQDVKVVAEHDFRSCPELDILVVPGAKFAAAGHMQHKICIVLSPLTLIGMDCLLPST